MKEVYRAEREVKRELPPGTSLEDPQGIVAQIKKEVGVGKADRELGEAARELSKLGL